MPVVSVELWLLALRRPITGERLDSSSNRTPLTREYIYYSTASNFKILYQYI